LQVSAYVCFLGWFVLVIQSVSSLHPPVGPAAQGGVRVWRKAKFKAKFKASLRATLKA
jgi:hypothetical protein